MPLFGELSLTSWDSFESESDSKESWDVWLNSSKGGIFMFFAFSNIESIEPIEPIYQSTDRSNRSKAALYDGLQMTMVCWARKKSSIFRDFWSCRPQTKSIWSKIWRWNWCWLPFSSSSSKISPNWQKLDFQHREQNSNFPESIFRCLGCRQAPWETGILTARSSRLSRHAMAPERCAKSNFFEELPRKTFATAASEAACTSEHV